MNIDEKDDNENYLDELSELDDDFDVEVKVYYPPPSFKSFVLKPFPHLKISTFKPITCKTGQIKLPKEIIEIYQLRYSWNFENYHAIELLALIYLHYYRNCDEWLNKKNLNSEINDILSALPHFKNIGELFSCAFINGDIKQNDFDQVIESDSSGSYDVTGLSDD